MFEPSESSTIEMREQWNAYLESYCRWAEQWERLLLQNRKITTAWQAEHDVPYPVCRLTYVVAPANSDNDFRTERALIWSLVAMPNEDDYWTVIEKGRAIKRRYRLWVSVDGAIMVRPSEEKFGHALYLADAQMNVFVHPALTDTAEELEQTLALAPLPSEPQQPRRLYEQLYPELAHDFDWASPRDWALHEYNRQREEQGIEPFDPERYETESWEGLEDDEESAGF